MTWVLFVMLWSTTGDNSPTAQHVAGFSSLEECRAAAEIIKKAEPFAIRTQATCVSQRTNKGT